MTEINRRTLIGAAGATGAGLMLAGCGPMKNALEGEADGNRSTGGAGYCQTYGQSVHLERPGLSAPTFTPNYMCAIYIKFGQVGREGRPTIRHAYARLQGTTTAALTARAEMLLASLRDNTYNSEVERVGYNLEYLSFGVQQYVVIFIDNIPGYVKFNSDPQNTRKHIIRFAPVGGYHPYDDREENHAFFNLKAMTIQGTFEHNIAYYMEFWNIDLDGNPLQPPHLYSMNIHLQMRAAPVINPWQPQPTPTIDYTWVPVVLDPDTGNMGSMP